MMVYILGSTNRPRPAYLRVVPPIPTEKEEKMDEDYTARAQELVRAEIFKSFQPIWSEEGEEAVEPPPYKTHIVWACKTLQNWKAIVISDLPDRKMYEVAYDGDKRRTYIDTYDKIDQTVVKDGEMIVTTAVPKIEKSDLEELDRNARAYGWEVGHGHPLVKKIGEVSPDNPFLDHDWQDKVQAGV